MRPSAAPAAAAGRPVIAVPHPGYPPGPGTVAPPAPCCLRCPPRLVSPARLGRVSRSIALRGETENSQGRRLVIEWTAQLQGTTGSSAASVTVHPKLRKADTEETYRAQDDTERRRTRPWAAPTRHGSSRKGDDPPTLPLPGPAARSSATEPRSGTVKNTTAPATHRTSVLVRGHPSPHAARRPTMPGTASSLPAQWCCDRTGSGGSRA